MECMCGMVRLEESGESERVEKVWVLYNTDEDGIDQEKKILERPQRSGELGEDWMDILLKKC